MTVTCFILGALNNNKAMMKAKILRKMTSTDSDNNDTSGSNKENVDSNKAAVVIQSRKIKTSWQIWDIMRFVMYKVYTFNFIFRFSRLYGAA